MGAHPRGTDLKAKIEHNWSKIGVPFKKVCFGRSQGQGFFFKGLVACRWRMFFFNSDPSLAPERQGLGL